MKEKDKAYELIASYRYTLSLPNAPLGDDKDRIAKQCALICVDEILVNIEATIFYHKDSISLPFNKSFWLQVRTEIEAL
jgi:hypothetical protein